MTTMKNPRPTGNLQGDDKDMPMKGSETGMTGHNAHLDGMSLGADATNSKGSITGACKSDGMEGA